jgi:hypothetical protein
MRHHAVVLDTPNAWRKVVGLGRPTVLLRVPVTQSMTPSCAAGLRGARFSCRFVLGLGSRSLCRTRGGSRGKRNDRPYRR